MTFFRFSRTLPRAIPFKLLTAIQKFLARSAKEQIFYFEAFFLLGLIKLILIIIPFRSIAPLLGRSMVVTPDVDVRNTTPVLQISWAVEAAGRHTPWESKCLAQAICGKMMLRLLGYPTTLYLGLTKDNEELKAHAWLRCGSIIVTGKTGHNQYTVIGIFGDK